MPKIVNKDEKRKQIAYQAYEYVCTHGIKSFSTDALIKYMNIGKSSLYNYFKSKDEILFEMFFISYDIYLDEVKESVEKAHTLKEKLHAMFKFYLESESIDENLRDLYKEQIITALENKTPQMLETNTIYLEKLNFILFKILEDEISKGNIKKEALEFSSFLQMNIDGIFLYSYGLEDFNLSVKVEKYIDSFIKLVEVEK